jgi:hypothetical protein
MKRVWGRVPGLPSLLPQHARLPGSPGPLHGLHTAVEAEAEGAGEEDPGGEGGEDGDSESAGVGWVKLTGLGAAANRILLLVTAVFSTPVVYLCSKGLAREILRLSIAEEEIFGACIVVLWWIGLVAWYRRHRSTGLETSDARQSSKVGSIGSQTRLRKLGPMVDITTTSNLERFGCRVWISRAAWDRYIEPGEELKWKGQSIKGRGQEVENALAGQISKPRVDGRLRFRVPLMMDAQLGTLTIIDLDAVESLDDEGRSQGIAIVLPEEGSGESDIQL